jgi:cyclic lactone autoinducer peptide
MKSQKKNYSSIIKTIVEKTVRVDANSTTCIAVYQPKAPAALKKFSKVENDK